MVCVGYMVCNMCNKGRVIGGQMCPRVLIARNLFCIIPTPTTVCTRARETETDGRERKRREGPTAPTILLLLPPLHLSRVQSIL